MKYFIGAIFGCLACIFVSFWMDGDLPTAEELQNKATALLQRQTGGKVSATDENVATDVATDDVPLAVQPSAGDAPPVASESHASDARKKTRPTKRLPSNQDIFDVTEQAAPNPSGNSKASSKSEAKADDSQDDLIRRTYQAIHDRDLVKAKTLVSELGQKKGGSKRAAAADRMCSSAMSFWNAVSQSVNSLGAGSTIQAGNAVAAYVEHGPDYIVLRLSGRNKTYRITELPAGIAVALAKRRLNPARGNDAVLLAAFVAIDKGGDIARARQYLQSAKSRGVNVDDLLSELNQLR